jgi:hypothetical protein
MAQIRVGELEKGDFLYVFSRKRKGPARLKIRATLPHNETVLIQFMGSEPSITMNKDQIVGADKASG